MAKDASEKSDKGSTEKVEVEKLNSEESQLNDFPNIDEKTLIRRIDLHIVPILTLLYLLSFIDRANIVSLFEEFVESFHHPFLPLIPWTMFSRTKANSTLML